VRPRSYGSRGLQSRASTAATPVVQLNAQFAPIPSWQRRIGAWHSCTSGPGARGINLSIRGSGGGCQCEMHALVPVPSSPASHRSTTSVLRSWQASRDETSFARAARRGKPERQPKRAQFAPRPRCVSPPVESDQARRLARRARRLAPAQQPDEHKRSCPQAPSLFTASGARPVLPCGAGTCHRTMASPFLP
jgi:hypothetical protein